MLALSTVCKVNPIFLYAMQARGQGFKFYAGEGEGGCEGAGPGECVALGLSAIGDEEVRCLGGIVVILGIRRGIVYTHPTFWSKMTSKKTAIRGVGEEGAMGGVEVVVLVEVAKWRPWVIKWFGEWSYLGGSDATPRVSNSDVGVVRPDV